MNTAEMFGKIEKLLANNELDEALEIAELAIQRFPEDAEGYYWCAEVYGKKGQDDKVVEYLKKACLLDSHSVKYLGRLAEKLFLMGEIDAAIGYYKKVLELEPVAWAYVGLGNAFERKDEIAKAIGFFQKALQVSDDYGVSPVGILNRLIKMQRLQGDNESVIKSLRKLIEVVSGQQEKYDALCSLARLYHLLDRPRNAIKTYLSATKIFPETEDAYVGLADTYHVLKKIQDEINVLQIASQINGSFELKQRLERLLKDEEMGGNKSVQASKLKESDLNSFLGYFLPQFETDSGAESGNDKNITLLPEENDIEADDLPFLVEIISESGLFNYGFYAQQTGKSFGVTEAIGHFLRIGAGQGLKAMLLFDYQMYRLLNADLPLLTNAQCFIHYVLKGRSEKRYYNRALLKRDASELRINPDFDAVWYASLITGPASGLDVYEHYLAIGWRQDLPPNRQGFDNGLYLNCHKDATESDSPPYLHYLRNKDGRAASQAQMKHYAHIIYQADEFDSAFYRIQYQEPIPDELSDILHYIYHGVELKLDPNTGFSTEYYIRKYPDVLNSGINPYVHYLTDGRREGRVGQFNAQKFILPGKCQFDPDKLTVLVVCHEATPTGAPILGLRLIEQLSQQANVISWVGRTGSLTEKETLREHFAASSVATIEHFFDHIDSIWIVRELGKRFLLRVAILNSAATAGIGNVLFEERVPIVALVHEYGDYMTDQISQIVFTANRVVLPSQSVKNSFDDVSVRSVGYPRTQIAIRHQGRCILPAPATTTEVKTHTREDILIKLGLQEDEEIPAIVFGCGTVTIRKGVEYFIEAARECKKLLDKPVRFVWVGSGYLPDSDFAYSVWLKSQIKFCGLEDEVIMFEETTDLAPFFELADVFFLSSRLDPFPNVAIDSVCAGVPVVAFDRVTGFSEFITEHPEVGAVVPCLDSSAAAVAICDYLTGKRVRHAKNNDIINLFSFFSYADFIWQECQTAINMQQAIVEESNRLRQANIMDVGFYKSGALDWRLDPTAEYRYVAMWARGIATEKSRVGFNDRVAQSLNDQKNGADEIITPLARVLKTQGSPSTHGTLYVNPDQLGRQWSGKLAVALHIHAYYIDDLASLLARLGRVGRSFWFCVTTDTDDKAKAIRSVVDSFSLNADIEVVTNRGRDIGPFIMSMKKHLPRFDIVGHFHLKGSKHIEQSVMLQWQNFVYNTLIGSSGEILNELLCAFEQNPKVGLLFPEDPCSVSWTKNFTHAQELVDKLGIKRELPKEIEFPGGNMFLARTAALRPLMDYDWQWRDFMAEPVPIDGTLLHAIERITPVVCEEAGYQWLTVHNSAVKRYS